MSPALVHHNRSTRVLVLDAARKAAGVIGLLSRRLEIQRAAVIAATGSGSPGFRDTYR
jgi:hypothetical protein